MRKYGIVITVRLSQEDKVHYDRLMERFGVIFCRSQSERFRSLLEKIDSPYDRNIDDAELEEEPDPDEHNPDEDLEEESDVDADARLVEDAEEELDDGDDPDALSQEM